MLDALCREAPLLASGDWSSYMSRVAWLAPAPNSKDDKQDSLSQIRALIGDIYGNLIVAL